VCNARELPATRQLGVTRCKRAVLPPEVVCTVDAPAAPHAGETSPHLLNDAVREAERRYLQEVLQSVGGQRKRAAQILGISRKTLWKKLKTLGLE